MIASCCLDPVMFSAPIPAGRSWRSRPCAATRTPSSTSSAIWSWFVEDPNDGIDPDKKKVIYIDGHTDTVKPLRAQWLANSGVDC